MQKLVDSVDGPFVVQSVVTVLVVAAIVYLALAQVQIPEVLLALGGTIIGYWFGTNQPSVKASAQAVRALIEK